MAFNSTKKYSDYQPGFPGSSPADGAPKYVKSYAAELSASQDMVAGNVLILGTNPTEQVRPTVNGDELDYHNFAGFMVLDPTKEAAYGSNAQYSDGDPVGVLKFGTMHCEAGGDVVAGEAVVVQVNGGALTSAHATGSLSSGQYFVPGARWEQSVSSGGEGLVSIGMSVAHREITGSL